MLSITSVFVVIVIGVALAITLNVIHKIVHSVTRNKVQKIKNVKRLAKQHGVFSIECL